MVRKSKCSCTSANTMVLLACSGGSNVGQIANDVAVALDKKGKAKFYCLAGVAAHIPGMAEGAKSAGYMIAIDGCPVGCAKKALEHLNINIDNYLIVTEEGIKKTYDLHPKKAEVEKILKSLESSLKKRRRTIPGGKVGQKSCCV